MSAIHCLHVLPRSSRWAAITLSACLFGPAALLHAANESGSALNGEAGPAVAVCQSDTGTVIRRESAEKPWQIVAKDEEIHSGDLLVGLPGAVLLSKNGKVRLAFRPDLTGQAPMPIIETALVVHESKDDLAFTLDRGRVDVTNLAKEGAARVQLRVRDKSGEITLKTPGSRMGIEMFGRWPAGAPFSKNQEPNNGPAVSMIFLVFHGQVDVKGPRRQFALTEPKGPAMLEWDSVTGEEPSAHYLEELPAWAKEDAIAPEVREKKARLDEFRMLAVSKSIEAALESFLNSDDVGKRRLAVFAMGALDDLRGLANALTTTKHLDVWDNGIIALRHWVGRCPGQDMKLYNGLVDKGKFKPIEAEAFVQLLHGFSEADLRRPETYGTLIDYLDHPRLALRGIAYWHLSRLVPAGREFGYNPMDEKEQRQKSVAKWQQLVPRGQVPKTAKPEGN
jgi:hypothetical protein